MNEQKWTITVDLTTVDWVTLFLVGLFAFDSDLFGFEEPLIAISEFVETLGTSNFTSLGSSLEVADISSGKADLYFITTDKIK